MRRVLANIFKASVPHGHVHSKHGRATGLKTCIWSHSGVRAECLIGGHSLWGGAHSGGRSDHALGSGTHTLTHRRIRSHRGVGAHSLGHATHLTSKHSLVVHIAIAIAFSRLCLLREPSLLDMSMSMCSHIKRRASVHVRTTRVLVKLTRSLAGIRSRRIRELPRLFSVPSCRIGTKRPLTQALRNRDACKVAHRVLVSVPMSGMVRRTRSLWWHLERTKPRLFSVIWAKDFTHLDGGWRTRVGAFTPVRGCERSVGGKREHVGLLGRVRNVEHRGLGNLHRSCEALRTC
ncbi:hypothetical protein B0J17DRAFT_255467 [Rhizoctonia solani]|nr:hypothetical protein B0J17DRAFT_255467 [Rhizoctonia solani]